MITAIQTANLASAGLSGSHAALPTQGAVASGGASPFADLLTDAVSNVGNLEDQARHAVDGLMAGSGVDVHQAMIASEKASMAFEMALAVRNKAIQSYQSVMSMQF
ncbi:MAG TPA: flagellar hook-basal body complex protein FliE [Terracidiphilus sp.]|nr:flagellar hook-basal body complex protein FliE [Terracidiphilus sp.]